MELGWTSGLGLFAGGPPNRDGVSLLGRVGVAPLSIGAEVLEGCPPNSELVVIRGGCNVPKEGRGELD
jgi:hypothetical protein